MKINKEQKKLIQEYTKQIEKITYEKIRTEINERVEWENEYFCSDDPEDDDCPSIIRLKKEDYDKITNIVYSVLSSYNLEEQISDIVFSLIRIIEERR